MRLYAPRTLNEPVRWRFSAFSCTSRPASSDSVCERYTGVTRATPSRRERAASMSGSVGAVSVAANSEHLLQDLTNRTERVELAALHLVEEPTQLRIVCDTFLEMPLCPRGGDCEHLAGKIAPPPFLEPPRLLEEGAVCLELLPQLGDVLAARRLGQDDRRTPLTALVERKDRAHLVQHRLRSRMIHLVDRNHVGDLHDSGLQRLDGVAR